MNTSYDSYKIEQGIRKFVEFLANGKSDIRVYKEDNIHAKVYIQRFDTNDRDYGRIITGSSNFSYSGLKGNREFNVELKNTSDTKFALEKFEDIIGLRPSESTIINFNTEIYDKLEVAESKIKEAIIESPVVNFDETGKYLF